MRTPGASLTAAALSLVVTALTAQTHLAPPAKRMLDGKLWTTENLNVPVAPSYCYDDAEENCRRYGRLYSWEAAQRACHALGGWRLPTNEEWRQLGTRYGGLRLESADLGKAAFTALIAGGSSGFNAVLGGGRTDTRGEYQRLDAHGLYWSATESGPDTAWLYNFGANGQSMNRHENSQKWWAVSVRCVRN
jgi:uncharacterized protein (TIGR02145 family)